MKPTAIAATVIGLVVLATGLRFALRVRPGNAPGFKPGPPASYGVGIDYDFLGTRPFEAGRMWIASGKDVVMFDLEKREVLGRVVNAWPVLQFGEPPRLLCYQPTVLKSPGGLRGLWLSLLARISRGRVVGPTSTSGELYWVLNLRDNAATRVGRIEGNPNTCFPSPDFRYGFTTRLGPNPWLTVYVLDLQRPSVQALALPSLSWAYDWWDNTRIFLKTTNSDFVLYDAEQKVATPFIALKQIASFLRDNGIDADPGLTQAFAVWNGQQNDFYLTDTHQRWLAEQSFLIKVQRPDGRLRLVSPDFKFEWSDHLDASGGAYVFSGREAGQGSDGVFLRDVGNDAKRVLVEPTSLKEFSLPMFYHDALIYVRSNTLWQIDRNGSNNVRLFPPPGVTLDVPRR